MCQRSPLVILHHGRWSVKLAGVVAAGKPEAVREYEVAFDHASLTRSHQRKHREVRNIGVGRSLRNVRYGVGAPVIVVSQASTYASVFDQLELAV